MKKKITYDKDKSTRDSNAYPIDYESIRENYKSTKPVKRKLDLDESGRFFVIKKD